VTATSRAIDRVIRARDALFSALGESAGVDLSFLRDVPTDDGWEAAPDLLRLLYALVLELRPRHVVEFGSGVSTAVLAHAARDSGVTVVTSIESDPKCAGSTIELIVDDAAAVSVQCAPLVARVQSGCLGPAYLVDRSLLASTAPADLVFVDGPPEVLGGRGTMLPQALEYAQCGSIVLFDDADREGERAALASWERILGDAIELHRPDGFIRGLVVLILVAPTTAQIRMSSKGA
jgi:predicted O-methyltransferase YrrM